MRRPRSIALVAWLAPQLMLGMACATTADPAPPDPADSAGETRWLLGVTLSEGPIYFGQRQRGMGIKPLFALRWRGLRISNSGAGSLLGDAVAGGASAELYSDASWRVRVGLRLDRGRRIEGDDEGRLADLPEVRSTLRARLSAVRRLDNEASLSIHLSPDLLGRDGGLLTQFGYYQRLPALDAALPWVGGRWSLSAQVVAGDKRYLKAYFGVPAAHPRFADYAPDGGLRSATIGLGWQRALGEDERGHWLLFAGASLERLLGGAARSTIVQQRGSAAAQLGLAYRY